MKGSKKHQVFDSRIPTIDAGYIHMVTVPYYGQSKNIPQWNQACISVMEVFGLPGEKFTSHMEPETMKFYFKSKKDYNLCRILLSEYI
jgi:hypothetical protein